ncbi:hypothetical protein PYW07_006385 [Mythimna separata]|uniref:Fucosyltransferase n=1 Tax=Mythimna separata TaxID=271217 RepID=A0AAD8DXL6_MYTSE|nr:hypothetical protein PYW07_006385 [Mythimna separata]
MEGSVSSPCDGTQPSEASKTSVPEASASTAGEVHVFPRSMRDDSITYNPLTNGESTEEQQGYTYNTYYNVPSTVNFHDIYSNSLALLAEDPVMTTAKDEELLTTLKDDPAFHLKTINTEFVEFHPKTFTIPPITIPTPMFPLNASYIKTDPENTTTTTTTTTTEEPDEVSVEVIPIKKEVYQRGVLDLLFPAARVRTFKSVFDTFRRLMSHTFRFLPPGSYINALELTATEVVEKMMKAIRNPNFYADYFRWHNYYDYVQNPKDPDVCRLCQILNEDADKRYWYKDFRSWWNPDYPKLCTNGGGRVVGKNRNSLKGILEIEKNMQGDM